MPHPYRNAMVIGRTPCTRNRLVRCRLVRLVSSACHCWNAALRVLTRSTFGRVLDTPRCYLVSHGLGWGAVTGREGALHTRT